MILQGKAQFFQLDIEGKNVQVATAFLFFCASYKGYLKESEISQFVLIFPFHIINQSLEES